MKEKLKKKSFWLSIAGLIIVVLQALGIKIDAPVVNEAVAGVSGFLVMLGILIDDGKRIEDPLLSESEESEEV